MPTIIDPKIVRAPANDALRMAFFKKVRAYDASKLRTVGLVHDGQKINLAPAAKKRALILLQENTGRIPLPSDVDSVLADTVYRVVDTLAETFEDIKTKLQTQGKYDKVVHLTDTQCTRANLLTQLVDLTKNNFVIDLIVLGHGTTNTLILHGGQSLTGESIRQLLPEAQARGVNAIGLRMVYMCNCVASTLNDDWLAIGAKVSIGSRKNNYMPEPVITLFLHNWIAGQKAEDAINNAYEISKVFYNVVYPPQAVARYTTKTVEVVDGVSWNPSPPPVGSLVVNTHKEDHQVFEGFDLVENSKITDSEPVTDGAKATTFSTV